MTSYEFEKAAKNAVIDIMKEYDLNLKIEELDFVWFAHELGHKKCTIYAKDMGKYYAEVTYNSVKDEMYVDIYNKVTNKLLTPDQFNFDI